jgi:hypothetical protein
MKDILRLFTFNYSFKCKNMCNKHLQTNVTANFRDDVKGHVCESRM